MKGFEGLVKSGILERLSTQVFLDNALDRTNLPHRAMLMALSMLYSPFFL